MLTAYDLLKDLRENPPKFFLPIDWKKARNYEISHDIVDDPTRYWEIIVQVGFDCKKIIPLVDPAIRPFIPRIYNLPIITVLGSCSGHKISTPKGIHVCPLLNLVFPDRGFGREFLRICSEIFKKHSLPIIISGRKLFCPGIPYQIRIQNTDVNIDHFLPIVFTFPTLSHIDQARLFWSVFSQALDHFDSQGEYTPTDKDLLMDIKGNQHDKNLLKIHTLSI